MALSAFRTNVFAFPVFRALVPPTKLYAAFSILLSRPPMILEYVEVPLIVLLFPHPMNDPIALVVMLFVVHPIIPALLAYVLLLSHPITVENVPYALFP